MHAERDNCYGKYVCLSVSIVVESKSESESSGSESESKSESKSSWLISDLGIYVAREPKMPSLRNVITKIYQH